MIIGFLKSIVTNTAISLATQQLAPKIEKLGNILIKQATEAMPMKGVINSRWAADGKNVDSAIYAKVFDICDRNTDLTRKFFMTVKHNSLPIYMASDEVVFQEAEKYLAKL